ncbi:reverse transcriptase [Gossypium australe]|uniref:Reverse transcriptase n=1 Tax=Gossypium australe TaxID=47621 RepID=A0A5B6WZC6_9ROSI|nr:reverse transcriptase [Gossypium australe]
MHNSFSNFVRGKWEFKDWNRDIYGFLGNRKRKLMRSLNNIQKALKLSTSSHLIKKEREIRDELENVLDHEDLLWRQKARCDWLQLGDKNTNFFHRRTVKRRKFNRIMSLRIDNGDWCSDQNILQNKAVEFFEKLYGEVPTGLSGTPNNDFPCLNSSEITFLEAPISNEEIKRALFDMAPLKAPGSDGYHALFFQTQWDILGNDVCQWVKRVFAGKPIELELNNTLIVLIPKKESPEDFSQFRPISLCTVLYKLVMKVIANRFKVIFPKLISQEQAGFIAGRNIFDNIILAQEVIHSMRCNRKGRKWMAIKLDLEKAYDRVSWDFINVSRDFDILAQCDHVRHFFFYHANSLEWGAYSEEVQNLGTYLGVPLLHDRVTKTTLNFVVEKIRRKLHSWDARKLSIAGRIALAQSVLLSIPSYFMQTMMIPKGVCDDIERMVRQFIWGSTERNYKMALVGWDTICQPRARGGLGLRKLNDQNSSFFMKIGFSLVSNSDMLWVRVLRSKYGWKNHIPESISRNQCSHLWRALSKLWPLIRENLIWSIRDGANVRCCKDPWIPGMGPLIHKIPSFSNLNLDCCVREMVNFDGSWNLDLFSVWAPEKVVNRISSIPPPHPDSGVDKVIWARSTTGIFSVRSTYWSLKEDTWNSHEEYWKIP